jgi:hypothetical protein
MLLTWEFAENSAGGMNALVSLRTLVILPDDVDIT